MDLAFTAGVLIHVDPSLLEATMREMHPRGVEVRLLRRVFSRRRPRRSPTGARHDLLFKNDFGSLYMDMFPDLELVDYGFFWRRTTVMDDSTWWLFRKV